MTIKMIEKLFLNGTDEEEDLTEEDKKLQAQTKANLERMATQKEKWMKKGGHTGVLALVAKTSISTMFVCFLSCQDFSTFMHILSITLY
jgi:hypothetical protein